MDSHACAHDVVLAVQVRLTKSVEAGGAILARGGGSLTRLLADGDVEVESVLRPEDLARHLLRTYESGAPNRGVASAAPSAADPWPMSMQETWSSVRVDGMMH